MYAAFFVGALSFMLRVKKGLLLSGVTSIGMTSLLEVFLYHQARKVQVQVQVQEEGFHGMDAAGISVGGNSACLIGLDLN